MSRRLALPVLALALSSPAFAENPPGATIDDAVAVDITESGLNAFLPLIDSFIPSSFVLPVVASATTFNEDDNDGVFDDCGFFETCYSYDVTNLNAALGLTNPSITSGNGVIDLQSGIDVTVNSDLDPMVVALAFNAPVLPNITMTCNTWIDPVSIPVSGAVQVDYNTFTGNIDAAILPVTYDVSALNSDTVNIDDCALTTINQITGLLGFDLIQLAVDQVIPLLEGQVDTIIDDLNDTLEPQINDAVALATISTSLDLLGTTLEVDIAPQDVQITPDGVRLLMGGSIDAPPSDCVAEYGYTGSLATPSSLDPLGTVPSGVAGGDVVVHADDDIVNQGLFAVWNGGLLCYTIDNTFEGLPIPLDTDLIGLLAPNVFDELFPDRGEILLQTRPEKPPVATLDGPNDLDVRVEDLGLDIYAEVDGRLTRLIGVDLAADAGANVGFNGSTGELTLDIDFETSAIEASVVVNEFRPEANADIESSLLGIVDNIAGPALSGLLADQTFAIPGFEGYGLTTADVTPTAGAPDRLGVYGSIGAIPYQGGCEGGGCDDAGAGCGDTTCDSTSAPGRVALFAVPLLLAAFRRRER
jgi:hypothetical protein